MGAKDKAVDAMIGALLSARQHMEFVSAVRALDRALTAGAYAIPVYNVREQWIARWERISRPPVDALAGTLPETWWATPNAK
jgi:peptide/nickel transport system substrate-binding protein